MKTRTDAPRLLPGRPRAGRTDGPVTATQRAAEPRPLTPADCMRARFAGRCAKCGAQANPTHSPTRLIRGVFCERCCPACGATGVSLVVIR